MSRFIEETSEAISIQVDENIILVELVEAGYVTTEDI
jgi:hypothetical protein